MKHLKPSLKACVKITGSYPKGALLNRIAYWSNHTVLKRGGYKWIANTREEWAEQTDLTFDQVKRALAGLRGLGLIVTEQHRFKGLVPNWLRLTNKAISLLKDSETHQTGNARTHRPKGRRRGARPRAVRSQATPNTYESISNGEKHQREEQASCGSVHRGGRRGGRDSARCASTPPDLVDASAQLRQLETLVASASSLADLEQVWRRALAIYHPGITTPLSGKEKQSMRNIRNAVPPGTAARIFWYVVRDWDGFTETVRSWCGLSYTRLPQKPSLVFLREYAWVAANWVYDVLTREGAVGSGEDHAIRRLPQ